MIISLLCFLLALLGVVAGKYGMAMFAAVCAVFMLWADSKMPRAEDNADTHDTPPD